MKKQVMTFHQTPRAGNTAVVVLSMTAALWSVPILSQAQMSPPAAQPKAEKMMAGTDEVFRTLDKNGDGVIDRDEAKADAMVDKNFSAINKSGSGKITRDELETFMMHKK